jgi:hypothetical protein
MRVRWTPAAFSDLKNISSYIERKRDVETANRVCRSIYSSVQFLRQFPEAGKPGIDVGTRELVAPDCSWASGQGREGFLQSCPMAKGTEAELAIPGGDWTGTRATRLVAACPLAFQGPAGFGRARRGPTWASAAGVGTRPT